MVIVQSAETRLALLVDELIGQQQCVVKNLESNYRQIDGVAGATILSDGQVALILDVAAIARHNQRALQQRNSGVWQGDAPLSFS
ncbi:chemotaxis protein CheW [Paludibacterium denitrificans]|uniref:chemotaxis protein CheW n=1 Tax=Paludibacterium denitrificans TaxID=2675226 RepID=UPI001E52392D|nr:chemotaxis protein CheW [Paludibacterium denitrificans]